MAGTTWSKFYWSDWLSDPSLRACSPAARGLWIDMLCVAAGHDPIGYVAVNGRSLSTEEIARIAGLTALEVGTLLGELERNGVFSRDRKGVIFSRRMVRDEKRAKSARKNGKNGGNPNLTKSDSSDNPVKGSVKGEVNTHKPEANSHKPEAASAARVDWLSGSTPSEDQHSPSNEFNRMLALCRNALGQRAPADAVVGPILNLCEKFGERRVLQILASEARRPRKKPVKTWGLWATIVLENLDATGHSPEPNEHQDDPSDPIVRLVDRNGRETGVEWRRSKVAELVQRWKENPHSWPPGMWPPGHPDCKFPRDILVELGALEPAQ
jgi:hypothetical protein